MTTLTVAAAQFATGTDVSANLGTVIRMVDEAATTGAGVVVLPEFCNHLSVYDDGEHAWSVAVDLNGRFVSTVAAAARRHGLWLQLNVTVRRERGSDRHDGRNVITNSNVVIDPAGRIAAVNDKTVLMGAEGEHLSAATEPSTVIAGDLGPIGTYACMDGVVPEVPRSVAARGARLLLNSLNSFARDEASLHIPIRAAENRAWLVACCKVGPLLPPDKEDAFAAAMGVPAQMLRGAGESQIVAPDGTVVAKGPSEGEAVVSATIDLSRAGQLRPDGADLWASRRPRIYRRLAQPSPPLDDHPRSAAVDVAIAADIDAVERALSAGARLVVTPEQGLAGSDADAVRSTIARCASHGDAVVVTTVRADGNHEGLVIDRTGIRLRQAALHPTVRHRDAQLADRLEPVDLVWGRLALLIGDDLLYPEAARLAALDSVDVLAAPFLAQEAWDTELAALERAAENRVATIVATPVGSVGRSVICDLSPDPTLWAPQRVRPFDGTINQPDATWADESGNAAGTVHPARSARRQISRGTDLVDGRPWALCTSLTDMG